MLLIAVVAVFAVATGTAAAAAAATVGGGGGFLPGVPGFWENVQPFIPRLRFFFFFLSGD